MFRTLAVSLLTLSFPFVAHAQTVGDAAKGKEGSEVCTVCHGANGISVSEDIPNLAGQKGEYLIKQLTNFRSGDRKNDFMNPIAAPLSDDDINNLAAFFSDLPHGGSSEASGLSKDINSARLGLPEDYATDFIEYFRHDPDEGKVRIFKANKAAFASLKSDGTLNDGAYIVLETYTAKLDEDGKPLKDANGVSIEDKLSQIIAQKLVLGGGKEIPEALRNGDWIFGAFEANGEHKQTNIAKCYACHKPQEDESYLFRFDELKAHALK